MPNETIPVYQKTKGSLMQNEDWWRLIIDDSGQIFVEHEWSYTDSYKGKGSNSSQSVTAVKNFLEDPSQDSRAQEKVREALKERGFDV